MTIHTEIHLLDSNDLKQLKFEIGTALPKFTMSFNRVTFNRADVQNPVRFKKLDFLT